MHAFLAGSPLPPRRRRPRAQRTPICQHSPLQSRRMFLLGGAAAAGIALPARARTEGVNRPELLPKEYTTVIDLENFLAKGEEARLRRQIADLESRTGFKLRILTQRFPQTPGAAVGPYWAIDDRSVLLVADYFGGAQLLKFNVGADVDKLLPPRFWSRLAAGVGGKFYVEKNGESAAICAAVDNIRACLLGTGCNVPPYLKDGA